MVFAYSPPVQAVPGDFPSQYPFTPDPVYRRIKQRGWRDAVALHPPGIDLHQAHVKTFAGRLSLADDCLGFRPRGRVVGFSGDIDGQGIQAGFLPGDRLHKARRRAGSFRHG